MRRRQQATDERGFTIVELMIATAVLSTILVVVTIVMISIGNLYYKGITQARIQDGVRSIADQVSQNLELSDGPVPDGGTNPAVPRAYCIGTTRYTYIENIQIGTSYPHVLWRDTIAGNGGTCAPAQLSQAQPNSVTQPGTNGVELIPPSSRLTDFTIGTTSPYSVSIGAAYGANGLLSGTGLGTTCQGNVGDQFCATAALKTLVVQRLSNS